MNPISITDQSLGIIKLPRVVWQLISSITKQTWPIGGENSIIKKQS